MQLVLAYSIKYKNLILFINVYILEKLPLIL